MILQVGDSAPDFNVPDQDGLIRSLGDYPRPLVLYFYPKDDTSG